MTAVRRLIFLKGRDAHDYKFSSAALEDYYHASPALQSPLPGVERLLAQGERRRGQRPGQADAGRAELALGESLHATAAPSNRGRPVRGARHSAAAGDANGPDPAAAGAALGPAPRARRRRRRDWYALPAPRSQRGAGHGRRGATGLGGAGLPEGPGRSRRRMRLTAPGSGCRRRWGPSHCLPASRPGQPYRPAVFASAVEAEAAAAALREASVRLTGSWMFM